MRLVLKREICKTLHLMMDMQDIVRKQYASGSREDVFDMLVQLQEAAIEIGEALEAQEGDYHHLITMIETYCEEIYRLGESMDEVTTFDAKADACAEGVSAIYQEVEKLDVKLKIAFFPYKYSMWDSLESIWRAACEDDKCICQVVPIPYYDREKNGSLGQFHYEGDAFPEEASVISYENYDLAVEKPDVVYIHNPYDEYNKVTCVDPRFFVERIKESGAMLLYVPYYMSSYCAEFENMVTTYRTKGAVHSDYIVLQSEKLKEAYTYCGIDKDKILVTGSPKLDEVYRLQNQISQIQEAWKIKLKDKKVILLNSSINNVLTNPEWLEMVEAIIDKVLGQKDMALIWRPHPLLRQTIHTLKECLEQDYLALCHKVQGADNGILDLGGDYKNAMVASDGMISDWSSLVLQYTFSGKPSLILNGSTTDRKYQVFCDYFSNYFVEDGETIEDFIQIILEEKDYKKDERMQYATQSVANADGTCGQETHRVIMDKLCSLTDE